MSKIKTFNQFVNEKAVSPEEALNEDNVGLVEYKTKHSTKEHVRIALYNFSKDVIEGFIAMEKFSSDEEYMIERVYAIDKHGPMMYEAALSSVSPKGIIPDRTIRPGAQSVWEFFDKNRSDVKKTKIPKDHFWYAKDYEEDVEHQHLTDKNVLDVLNKIYSVDKPLKGIKELLDKGTKLMEKNKLSPKQIIEKGEADFGKRYTNEFK